MKFKKHGEISLKKEDMDWIEKFFAEYPGGTEFKPYTFTFEGYTVKKALYFKDGLQVQCWFVKELNCYVRDDSKFVGLLEIFVPGFWESLGWELDVREENNESS